MRCPLSKAALNSSIGLSGQVFLAKSFRQGDNRH